MLIFFTSSLVFSLLAGQLIKIPLYNLNGIILLDLAVILLDFILLYRLKLNINSAPEILKFSMPFLLVAIISLLFSPVRLNLSEYFISFSYTLRLFSYILLAALLSLGYYKNLKQYLPLTFALSGILLAIAGLLQLLFIPNIQFLQIYGWDPHFYRVVSTWLDPNFLGAYFILTLLLLSKKTLPPLSNKVKLIFFFLVFIALIAAFSRSSILMFAVSFALLSLLKKSAKFFVITIILTLILYGGLMIYSQLIAVPNNINREQSAGNRISTWEVGLELVEKFPVLGVGFNSYRYALKGYSLKDITYTDSRAGSGNDSSLLFILATTGFLGLITYLYFSLSLLRKAINNISSEDKLIFISGAAGLLIHSFFNNSLFYPPLLLWLLLMGI